MSGGQGSAGKQKALLFLSTTWYSIFILDLATVQRQLSTDELSQTPGFDSGIAENV